MPVISHPSSIAGLSLAALRGAVNLQTKGLGRRGRSAAAIAKGYGYRGTTEKIAEQLSRDLEAHHAYHAALLDLEQRGPGILTRDDQWRLARLAHNISSPGRAYLAAAHHPPFVQYPDTDA